MAKIIIFFVLNRLLSLIIGCFMKKGLLENFLKPDLTEEAYVKAINASWDPLIQTGYSFVITDKANRMVGVSLSFDANNEPQQECASASLCIINTFLASIETPVRLVYAQI